MEYEDPSMRIGCVHISRFAIEVERQRRNDVATRLILRL
jgi:ribosomal protein S7